MRLIFYDWVALGLLAAGLVLLYAAAGELSASRYLTGLLLILVGVYVLSKGVSLLKVSAAAKMAELRRERKHGEKQAAVEA